MAPAGWCQPGQKKKRVQMNIEETNAYGKMLRLLDNRIQIINDMLGFTRHGCLSNPMRLVSDGSMRYVMLDCCEVARFKMYEFAELEKVIERVDGMNDGIWFALRQGFLKVA